MDDAPRFKITQIIKNLCILCVIVSHALIHIPGLKTDVGKMTDNAILRHLGIIPESENPECIDECDC